MGYSCYGQLGRSSEQQVIHIMLLIHTLFFMLFFYKAPSCALPEGKRDGFCFVKRAIFKTNHSPGMPKRCYAPKHCCCEPVSNLHSSLHDQSPCVNYSDCHMATLPVWMYDTQKGSTKALFKTAYDLLFHKNKIYNKSFFNPQ